MTDKPADDRAVEKEPGPHIWGNPDDPGVAGTFTRLTRDEFTRLYGTHQWFIAEESIDVPDRPIEPYVELPVPPDGTGSVIIEKRPDGIDWTTDWLGDPVDNAITMGLAGPHRGTMEECIDWALHEAKPARIVIHLA